MARLAIWPEFVSLLTNVYWSGLDLTAGVRFKLLDVTRVGIKPVHRWTQINMDV
jgi:hypothetical protein